MTTAHLVRHVYILAQWQTTLFAHVHSCVMIAVCCRYMVHQWLSAGAQHWLGGPHFWHLPACLGCLATIHPAPCLQREFTACPLFIPLPVYLLLKTYHLSISSYPFLDTALSSSQQQSEGGGVALTNSSCLAWLMFLSLAWAASLIRMSFCTPGIMSMQFCLTAHLPCWGLPTVCLKLHPKLHLKLHLNQHCAACFVQLML